MSSLWYRAILSPTIVASTSPTILVPSTICLRTSFAIVVIFDDFGIILLLLTLLSNTFILFIICWSSDGAILSFGSFFDNMFDIILILLLSVTDGQVGLMISWLCESAFVESIWAYILRAANEFLWIVSAKFSCHVCNVCSILVWSKEDHFRLMRLPVLRQHDLHACTLLFQHKYCYKAL